MIDSVIEDINKEIISTVTSPEFEILVFKNNEISTQKISDIRYMIANNLKIPVEIINISNEKTLEFVPFYVSLQDQISNYVAERKNGEWTIREFPILNEYVELASFVNANSRLIKFNKQVSAYINALLHNQEMDLTIAEDYWNVVSIDPLFENVKQQVDKYLISKLMNNEC